MTDEDPVPHRDDTKEWGKPVKGRPAGSHEFQVEVIEALEVLASMAQSWNDLLAESRSNTLFLTWEWVYSWTESFIKPQHRLFVLTVHDENELIGVAPWYIQRARYWGLPIKTITFLGGPGPGSDYVDVIARRGKEKEVAERLYQFLMDRTAQWDAVSFQDIPNDSLFLLHFGNAIKAEGKYAEVEAGEFYPRIKLPKTEAEYLAQLSPKRRRKFAGELRTLERDRKVLYHFVEPQQAEQALREFDEIDSRFRDEREDLIRFLGSVIGRCKGTNWVRIMFVNVDGRNIAGLVNFQYAGTLFGYQMAIDHSFDRRVSLGSVLISLCIKNAIAEEVPVYDLLRGSEDYKFHWVNGGRRTLCLTLYTKKFAPVMWMVGRSLKAIIKLLVR